MIATNAFKQSVVGTYTATATVIELNSISDTVGNADYLPNGGFNLILYDGLFGNPADANNAGKYEILECSSVNYATNEVTVVRARENTTAVTIDASSWQVVYGATKELLESLTSDWGDIGGTLSDQTDLQNALDAKIPTADIINDLVTGGATKVLSAEQGVVLKTQLDAKGKVLQVIQATYSTEVTITSETPQDSGLTGTITPSSATSKILVMITQHTSVNRPAEQAFGGVQVLRGSTVVYKPYNDTFAASIGLLASGTTTLTLVAIQSYQYLDSPATTSALTYKTQGRIPGAGTDIFIRFQGQDVPSVMILIEIEN